VRVYAADDTAFERPSNEVPLIVSLPIRPSAPANLLATVSGNRVDLAWTNTFTGGAPTGLVLNVSGAVNTSLPIAVAESVSFNGVPPGTYALSVAATNAGGTGPSSNAVTVTFPTTCSGSPLTPTQFLAYRLGRTLSVLWQTADTGPAPTDFVISVPELRLNLATGGARSASGSVPPGTYTLSVASRNGCGVSVPTASQTIVVP
jgi:hypothetical protein